MVAPLASNRYSCPKGYRQYPGPRYIPWNSFVSPGSPGLIILGAVQQLNISAVPPDLSTLTLVAPDGSGGTIFQLVYNASVWGTGIKVPLPASGASTAAQTATQLLSILSQKSGVDFNGVTHFYPWVASAVSATQIAISWTVAGANRAPELPANILSVNTSAQSYSAGNAIVPGIQGKTFSFLPG